MPQRPVRRPERAALLAALLTIAAASAGCVERRFIVRAVDQAGRPVNALATINGQDAGVTPTSINYEYYGDRRLTLEAEGYQTAVTTIKVRAPWWDTPLIGFISENVIPMTLRDERTFTYELAPVATPQVGDLLGRGQRLRSQALTTEPPRKPRFFGLFNF